VSWWQLAGIWARNAAQAEADEASGPRGDVDLVDACPVCSHTLTHSAQTADCPLGHYTAPA